MLICGISTRNSAKAENKDFLQQHITISLAQWMLVEGKKVSMNRELAPNIYMCSLYFRILILRVPFINNLDLCQFVFHLVFIVSQTLIKPTIMGDSVRDTMINKACALY